MTELQKEYCEEKGLIYIKPENTEISDYVNWLEDQILALRIHDVVGRSEQLPQFPQMHGLIECECGEVYDVDIESHCPCCGN